MSEQISFWIEHTVTGALYLTAALLLIFGIYRVDGTLLLSSLHDFLPYLFVIYLTLASIIGYSAQQIVAFIIRLLRNQSKYDPQKVVRSETSNTMPTPLRKLEHNFFIVLVLYRHLVLTTPLNWYFALYWLSRTNHYKYSFPLTIIAACTEAIFTATYLVHRHTFNQFKKALTEIPPNDFEKERVK